MVLHAQRHAHRGGAVGIALGVEVDDGSAGGLGDADARQPYRVNRHRGGNAVVARRVVAVGVGVEAVGRVVVHIAGAARHRGGHALGLVEQDGAAPAEVDAQGEVDGELGPHRQRGAAGEQVLHAGRAGVGGVDEGHGRAELAADGQGAVHHGVLIGRWHGQNGVGAKAGAFEQVADLHVEQRDLAVVFGAHAVGDAGGAVRQALGVDVEHRRAGGLCQAEDGRRNGLFNHHRGGNAVVARRVVAVRVGVDAVGRVVGHVAGAAGHRGGHTLGLV